MAVLRSPNAIAPVRDAAIDTVEGALLVSANVGAPESILAKLGHCFETALASFWQPPGECPRRESNPHRAFRKRQFYPLNYEDC